MGIYTKGCSAIGGFSYANNFTLYVILNETDIDIANNRSKIQYDVYCQSNGSGSINSKHAEWFSLNGKSYVDRINNPVDVNAKSPNAYIPIANGTTEYITHNNDGTMSIPFEASIKGKDYGISADLTGTFIMSTIARASSISCTTANIEETATIIINSAVSTYTHNVYARLGEKVVTVLQNVRGGTYSWTIPKDFYSQIPNAKSGIGYISIETYNNGNQVGDSSGINFNVTTNETKCKPTLSATVVDTNNNTINLTGSNTKLVKHKSTAKITINTTAKNSATIKEKKVNNTNVSDTTLSISNVTINNFTVTVTDSRGYSNSITLKSEMINYIPLSLSANVKRKNPTSSEVLANFSGNYFNANFGKIANTLNMSWKYKNKATNTYTNGGNITPKITNNTYSNNGNVSLGELFNYQDAYDIQLTVSDKLTTVVANLTITQGIPIFNWGKDFFNINGRFLINNVEQTLVDYTSKINAINGTFAGGKVYKFGRVAYWQINYMPSETNGWGEICSIPAELEPLTPNSGNIYFKGLNISIYNNSGNNALKIYGEKKSGDLIGLVFSYITNN